MICRVARKDSSAFHAFHVSRGQAQIFPIILLSCRRSRRVRSATRTSRRELRAREQELFTHRELTTSAKASISAVPTKSSATKRVAQPPGAVDVDRRFSLPPRLANKTKRRRFFSVNRAKEVREERGMTDRTTARPFHTPRTSGT